MKFNIFWEGEKKLIWFKPKFFLSRQNIGVANFPPVPSKIKACCLNQTHQIRKAQVCSVKICELIERFKHHKERVLLKKQIFIILQMVIFNENKKI